MAMDQAAMTNNQAGENLSVRCCIVGGGPAGMMLGFLLARAGIDVVVLEKHADFLRDFRGDTIHPSTLQVMHELGLLDAFLKRPHQEMTHITAQVGAKTIGMADFSRLPTRCRFIALMPQWDFLDFLSGHARRYPGFHLRMKAEGTGLIEEDGQVRGVEARTSEGPLRIRAHLVVGADGRHSVMRDRAGFKSQEIGAPMDVLWFRLSRKEGDPAEAFGHIEAGRMMVMINRGDYWQCGFIVPKGSIDRIQAKGIEAFRADVVSLSPFVSDRVGELASFEDVKLLTVAIDRLETWARPGLLCIGDAAHAMSPIGGVGINLAIQDAVAAANILALPLREGPVGRAILDKVQERREWPTRMTQGLQVAVQKRVISPVLKGEGRPSVPWPMRLVDGLPFLQRLTARVIGLGFRPEHVHVPERAPAAPVGPS